MHGNHAEPRGVCTMTKRVNLDLKNLNLPLLLKQKQALLRAIERSSADDALYLDGILSLLDFIHDTLDPPKMARRMHGNPPTTEGV
jgi:hypothetical protein